MAERDPRDYHKLDVPLSEISSRIKLKEKERKEVMEDLKQIIEEMVIPAMKEADQFFKRIYKRLMPSGSYYENLKISEPNEFDLNIELQFPSKDIEVLPSSFPGFVEVKYNGYEQCFSDYDQGQKKWNSWLDDGKLKRNEVLQWMQSVMARALLTIPKDNFKISSSRQGPAITLRVVKSGIVRDTEFWVDLVPVLIFDEAYWPKPPVRQPVFRDFVTWYIVPKGPLNDSDERTHWRMSFYDQERRMMNDYNAMKPIIKLIKKLRDCQDWVPLSSYYIKTVFLWEMEKENYDKTFWQKSIGCLFIDMLKRFVKSIKEERSIPFFWDERHDLISKLTLDTIINIGNRIENIVDKIERNLSDDPDYVKTFFPGWDSEDNEGGKQSTSFFSSSANDASSYSEEIENDSDSEIFSSPFSGNHWQLQRRQEQDQSLENIGTWGAIGIGALAVALGVTMIIRGVRENNRQ